MWGSSGLDSRSNVVLIINDLEDTLHNCRVKLYADNTVLYSTSSDEATAHMNVRQGMNFLYDWCNKNKLTVDINKTKLMLFGTRNVL